MTGMIEAVADAAAAVPVRRPQIRIDWQRAASLLVDGHKPPAVAATLGIPEVRLWRHLRHSLRFRTLIRRAMDRQRLLAQIQYGSLQASTMHHALQGERPDGTELQWLSAEVAPASAADDKGSDLVDQLGETAARYPSQALRKRIAAEKAGMDAQVAASRAALACHMAARSPAEAAVVQPDLTATAPNSTATASDSTPTASISTVTAPAATKPAPAPRAEGPILPPRHPGPPRISPTIVDLTDMDGNPLPQEEHWPRRLQHKPPPGLEPG